MRDELLKKIEMLFIKHDVDVGDISSELFMVLNDYEITKRCTEIATTEQRDIDFYVKKFLLAKKVKGLSTKTLTKYQQTLSMFFREIPKNPIELEADDIRLFIALKETRDHVSKIGLQSYLRDVSSFCTWMHDEEYIRSNPMKKVDSIKCPKIKKSALSEIEIEKIRYACESAREMMIVEVLLSTGCRVSEFVEIRISDLEEDGIVVHGKGQKDRTVYLNAKAKMAIEKYMAERSDTNPYLNPRSINDGKRLMFKEGFQRGRKMKDLKLWYQHPEMVDPLLPTGASSIEEIMRNLGKRSGVEKVHPHRMRRTCATRALSAGMPIEYVSKMLGHESIETTQIYLDLSEETMRHMHEKYVR